MAKLQKNLKVLDAVVLTANITSEVIDLSEASGFAVHSIYTGTPTGDIKIDGSNDGVNFVEVDSQALVGAAGQDLVNLPNQMFAFARVRYVFSLGTGALTSYISLKG